MIATPAMSSLQKLRSMERVAFCLTRGIALATLIYCGHLLIARQGDDALRIFICLFVLVPIEFIRVSLLAPVIDLYCRFDSGK